MSYQAMCPHCGGNEQGCAKCVNGKVEVTYPKEFQYWERVCQDPACGQINGGAFYDCSEVTARDCCFCGAKSKYVFRGTEKDIDAIFPDIGE